MFRKPVIPVLLWEVVILVLSGLPGHSIPRFKFLSHLGVDKIVHGCMYFILSFLLVNFFRTLKQGPFREHPAILAITIASLYGIGMEICQALIFTGRSAELADAAANILGAIIGAWAYYRFYPEEPQRGVK
jgi:VanZ family protein